MSSIHAIGIDLGTTYSSVSMMNEHGEPEILPNFEGERLTPSVVFFDQDSVVVGQIAKDSAETNPDDVVMFIKRQLGDPHWYFKYKEEKLKPEDVSAVILKKLKKDAEEAVGALLPYVVITVPAYFDDERRRATINAGKIAGFKDVLSLINEPTAAAIAFGLQHTGNDETVLVYDLGGGTFDVTLLRVEEKGNSIRIIATDGDHKLGGKDFDDGIIRKCVAEFNKEHGFDPTVDPCEMQQLRQDAEKAKKELTSRTRTIVMVRAKGKRSRVTITREEFDQVIKSKIGTTFSLIRTTLREARLEPQNIDRILLIGGSTRIPLVRNEITKFFGKSPDTSVNPDEAVSMGAAIVAAKKYAELSPEDVAEEITDIIAPIQITDVVSHSFGIEAMSMDGKVFNSILIKKNSPIPTEISKEFTTTKAGQTGIKVVLYQGEFSEPNLCNPIGAFILGGLPPNRPPGKKVRVSVACTNNGIVEVTALDIESGKQASTQVSYKTGQSTKQVSAKAAWLGNQAVE